MAGKKLIEVALPLDAVNAASAREKSIRHGHPSTLHLWWARRPLAAARAVIFAQMVDDPSEYVDVLLSDPAKKRAARRALKRAARLAAAGPATVDDRSAVGTAAGPAATRVRPLDRDGDGGTVATADATGRASLPSLREMAAALERERLFEIIRALVKWENTTNEEVLERARREIWQSWRRACAVHADHPRAAELFDRHRLPAFHDPFAGGGSLPLEAQRLGLEAHASDLNPVAVLINKAMIEVPPRFAGRPPVHPEARAEATLVEKTWRGAQGLAEDVRRYGRWMRDEAERRIGHLYPKVEVTPALVRERPDLEPYAGRKLTVIAWLWARTVKSPNPAFAEVEVPLASTFMLSTKKGKEAYVEPVVAGRGYRFTVKVGAPPDAAAAKRGTKSGSSHSNFLCLMSGTPMPFDYLRAEAKAKRLGMKLMAIVAEGNRGRVYLPPLPAEQQAIARSPQPAWAPTVEISHWPGRTNVVEYGLTTFGDLFTPRQLVALTTFSDLVGEAAERVRRDARAVGLRDDGEPLRDSDAETAEPVPRDARATGLRDDGEPLRDSDAGPAASTDANPGFADDVRRRRDGGAEADDGRPLRDGGAGAAAYADAVALYLALAVSRTTDTCNSLCRWQDSHARVLRLFGRQAIPMVWSFAEPNVFAGAFGDIATAVETVVTALSALGRTNVPVRIGQADARQAPNFAAVRSTDPPYYDNIGYADLSDFFYVWLRRSLRPIYPDLFATLAVPKMAELVATPYRHGGKDEAENYFLDGMKTVLRQLSSHWHPGFPVTIYYAFKQTESRGNIGAISTGWETFLEAVITEGFTITGTWPVRTELESRSIAIGTNALASSIVLVCRRRPADAPAATRRECVTAIRAELPPALRLLQTGNVAPVDLAQAAIGPGMAVYTRYARALSVVAAESNEPADHRHAARVWTYAANATTDPWQAQRPVARTPPRLAGVAVVPGPFQPQRTQHALGRSSRGGRRSAPSVRRRRAPPGRRGRRGPRLAAATARAARASTVRRIACSSASKSCSSAAPAATSASISARTSSASASAKPPFSPPRRSVRNRPTDALHSAPCSPPPAPSTTAGSADVPRSARGCPLPHAPG